MRRTLQLLWLFLLLAVPVAAQDGQRIANPPLITIELSGIEPRPADFPAELIYGGLGGGGGDITIADGIYWDYTPGAFAGGQDAELIACGYSNMQQPTATLTYPDGRSEQIDPTTVDTTHHCFTYKFIWQIGIELGLYTLTLDHADGQLTHTWGMDYPFCRTVDVIDNHQWLMGFAPNEQLSTVFFMPGNSETGAAIYVASRNVQADSEGTLAIDIKVARSAPFTADTLTYVIVGPQRKIYYPPDGAFDLSSFEALGYYRPAQSPLAPRYLTHSVLNYTNLTGGSLCNSAYGDFVEIVPSNGSSIPLYADVNSDTIIGQVGAGAPAQVLEYRPVMSNGRVAVWKNLRMEDGSTGWNPSNEFVGIDVRLVPGGHVTAAQTGVYDALDDRYHPGNPTLYSAPDPNAPQLGTLAVGTPMIAYGYRVVGENQWWYVQLNDKAGWLPQYDLINNGATMQPLPWATVEVNQPGAPWKTCPGSPPTHLVVGMNALVTPGDANRLRATPENGNVVGQIPPGDSFRIESGPVCGSNAGLTWWQVTYQDQTGWTAEGQGDQYWLAPAP